MLFPDPGILLLPQNLRHLLTHGRRALREQLVNEFPRPVRPPLDLPITHSLPSWLLETGILKTAPDPNYSQSRMIDTSHGKMHREMRDLNEIFAPHLWADNESRRFTNQRG